MKAIILAAGQGVRLKPLTNDRPKCMVEYRGKPIIDHVLETMKKCQLTDIVLVKGYRADMLNRNNVKCIVNPRYHSTNMVVTLFCAEEEMNDDVIISYADIVYEESILQKLIDEPSELSVVVDKDWRQLWERRMQDPLKDAETLKLDQDGFILEVGKKPRGYDDIQGQYMGLIKIRKNAIQRVRDCYHQMDRSAKYDGMNFDNMFMTSFIQHLIDNAMPVKAVFIEGGWVEIDSLEDLKKTERP